MVIDGKHTTCLFTGDTSLVSVEERPTLLGAEGEPSVVAV